MAGAYSWKTIQHEVMSRLNEQPGRETCALPPSEWSMSQDSACV